jgi:hypothetical protein
MLKTKGSIAEGLAVLEEALNSQSISDSLDEHIRLELESKRLQSKTELLKWDEIAQELSEGQYSKK